MKVNLRNKAGEFCTLKEYCEEQPKACYMEAKTMAEAAKTLPKMRENLLQMRKLVEVIDAFDIKQSRGTTYYGVALTWAGEYDGPTISLKGLLMETERNIRLAEDMVEKWQATSYEVE